MTAAATLALLGFGLYRLGDRSIWFDEAFTIGTVDRPLGDALWRIGHWELNQSPHYLLVLAWQHLGNSEAFLRLPSVAFAVATVPLVYVLGRRLADPWVGAIAAAVVAGHALVVQWSQQVRGYTLATLLVVVATLLLLRAVERPTTGRIVAYSVVAAAATYAHLLAVLVIAAHGVSLLLLRPIPWRLLRLGGAVTFVLGLPLAVHVLTRQGDPLAWVGEGSGPRLVDELADVAGGGIRHLVVLGAIAAVGAVTSVAAVRRRPGTPEAWRAALPVVWLALPIAVVVVSTYTVKPLLVARFLIVVVPALAILIAVGIRRLPRAGAAVAVVALVVVSAQGVRDSYNFGDLEDWRGAVASVSASALPGDDVVSVPGTASFAVRYYDPELTTTRLADLDEATGERLWVFELLSKSGAGPFVPPEVAAVLDEDYRVVEERPFHQVRVRLYERR